MDCADHVYRLIFSREAEDEVGVTARIARIIFDDLKTARLERLLQLSYLNPIPISLAFRVEGEPVAPTPYQCSNTRDDLV